MLDPEAVDLRALAEALEDHSFQTSWTLNPMTGQVEAWPTDDAFLEDEDKREEPGENLIPIHPVPSRFGYSDMEDFIGRVSDPKAAERLARAIAGRGAFRRFKDTLFDFPELREAWFAFHDARLQRRAVDWLRDEGLVDDAAAENALAKRADPDLPVIRGRFDAQEIARRVAADLRVMYGDRFRGLILFGSQARGDAREDSDIDLLVILDTVEDVWREGKRMNAILDQHSEDYGTIVVAIAVAEDELSRPRSPAIFRALEEGIRIA